MDVLVEMFPTHVEVIERIHYPTGNKQYRRVAVLYKSQYDINEIMQKVRDIAGNKQIEVTTRNLK